MPNTWNIALGEEVASKVTKGSSPKWQGFNYQSDGVLFVTSENVRDGYLDVTSPKYLPPEFSLKQKNSILKDGDILINIVGASIGRSCKFIGISSPANVNQAVCVFRSRPGVLSDFILASFQSSKGVDRLLSSQVESARPNVSLSDIRKFDITLPPLPEQKAITEVLSSWDRGIRKLEAKLEATCRINKGLMQALVSGDLRLNTFGSKPKEYQLGDFTKWGSGGTPSKQNATFWNGTIPWVSARSMRGHKYSDSIKKITLEGLKAGSRLAPKGSLLLLTRGSMLFKKIPVGIVERDLAFNQDVKSIIPDIKVTSADYLLYWFCANEAHILGLVGATGIGAGTLDTGRLKAIKMTLPPVEEQQAIVKILNAADRELDALERKLSNWKAQKKYLLNNLVDGTIRLPQFINAEAC